MKNLLFYTVFFSCSLSYSITTFATEDLFEDKDLSEDEEAFDEELLFGEPLSVFSASKYEQKVTDAPARISIVTAEEIKRFGHRTLVEVINTLPGFQTNDDSSYSYVGTRGFGVPGDYNTRILILIDGHRMNEKIYDGVVIDEGFIVDIDMVERIEAIRGPASSLYGSNAVLGVINVITKRGRDLQGLELSGSTGSENTNKVRISYGRKTDNDFEWLLSANYLESDGDNKIYYHEYDSPETNNGLAENVDGSDSVSLYASFSTGNLMITSAYQTYTKYNPTGSYESFFNDPRNATTESHAFFDLKYQHLFENGADLTARLFYDNYRYEGAYVLNYAEEGELPDLAVWEERAEGIWVGTEISVTKSFFDTHRVTLGMEYEKSLRERQLNFDIYDVYLDIDPKSNSTALYLQDNFQISDGLIFNFGIRYDDYSTFGSSTNPRMALIWNTFESATIKFIYGTAFRAPNSFELDFHDNGDSQKSPESLDSESITTTEIILEQKLSTHWNLMLSVYNNEIEDLIALTKDPVDGLVVFQNQDKVNAKGIEIEFQSQWISGWANSMSYTYQDSKFDSGGSLPNTTENMLKFNLMTPTWGNGFKAAFELKHEDGRPLLFGGKTKANSISNLSISHDELIEGLFISASIYNLFDKDYSYPGGVEHLQEQLKQPGRNFRVLFNYHY